MQLPGQERTTRHVIVLAYNFPPMGGGGVQRSAKFVKYLPQFGWVPAVVAADDPSYWARDDTLIDDIAAETVVKRLSPMRPHALYYLLSRITSEAASGRIMGSLFFPDDRILWAIKASLAARAMIKKQAIRAVYTTSPPHSTHVSGLILKRMTGLPWVADFRDPWTGDFRYDSPARWVRRAHSCCERKILEEADRVICNTESSRKNYITGFGIDPKRLVTIYNGFDASDFIPNPGRRHRSSDRIIITHSGSFYGSYFPETFVRALGLVLKSNADLERRIVVRFVGVMDREIRENIRGLLPDHCDFWGYVSHAEAIRAIAESDINLIVLPVEEKASYLVPGKLFEYLAAQRPILAIAPQGETARIIESAGAGIVLSEDGAGELADALSRAIPMLAAGGRVPDKATADRFERRRLTGQLAQVLNDVIGE